MSEKLLTLRELRILLAGPGCPFTTPPAPATIRGWVKLGLKSHVLPGGNRKHFRLSEVLEFLRTQMEAVGRTENYFQTFIATQPVAWQRAGRKGGFSYTPTKTRNAEDFLKIVVAGQWKVAPLDEPLDLEIFVFTEKPKSAPKRVLFPAVKPDWDNLGKLVGDALNGILWKDDARIVDGAVRKRFCDEAHPQAGYLLILRRA